MTVCRCDPRRLAVGIFTFSSIHQKAPEPTHPTYTRPATKMPKTNEKPAPITVKDATAMIETRKKRCLYYNANSVSLDEQPDVDDEGCIEVFAAVQFHPISKGFKGKLIGQNKKEIPIATLIRYGKQYLSYLLFWNVEKKEHRICCLHSGKELFKSNPSNGDPNNISNILPALEILYYRN